VVVDTDAQFCRRKLAGRACCGHRLCGRSSLTTRRQLATVGVHRVHRNAVWLDQVSISIDSARGSFARALQSIALRNEWCDGARREDHGGAMNRRADSFYVDIIDCL
jgi:hypothetical protein